MNPISINAVERSASSQFPDRRRARSKSQIAAFVSISVLVVSAAMPACARSHHRSASNSSSNGAKKVIWFGGFKGPKQLTAQDLANASQAFDGFVVQNVYGSKDDPKTGGSFAWEAFTNKRYTLDSGDTSDDYIGDSLDALEKLPPTPLPDRFLRVNASPYDADHFDWQNDDFWNNVCHNMEIAGEICQKAGLTGIFLDTEPYHSTGHIDVYQYGYLKRMPPYSGLSYQDVADIVEKRGRQVIQALNQGDPNLKILVSFGYTTVSQHEHRAEVQSALLPAFLDGLLDGSTPDTTFVDAFEAGYWHGDWPGFFDTWAHIVKDKDNYNFKFQKYPEKYASQYRVAMGLFLDRDRASNGQNGVYGWCGDTKKEMFYSPARLAYTVQQAIKASDEYVWFYTNRPNAWLAPDSPGGIPSALAKAIRDGEQHGNDPSLPPLPPNYDPIAESAICH